MAKGQEPMEVVGPLSGSYAARVGGTTAWLVRSPALSLSFTTTFMYQTSQTGLCYSQTG